MIENQTIGVTLYFKQLTLLAGEEIIIDCAKSRVSSSIRGEIPNVLVPISSIQDFTLAPGDNKVVAFMINDVLGKMQIGYTPQHHGADATVRVEELQ